MKPAERGFSLIEVLVGAGLVSLVVAMLSLSLSAMARAAADDAARDRIANTVENIVADLSAAQCYRQTGAGVAADIAFTTVQWQPDAPSASVSCTLHTADERMQVRCTDQSGHTSQAALTASPDVPAPGALLTPPPSSLP